MRLLLISDTHGKLGIINELAEHTQADAVIHAGDFGFYDNGSYERLSNRELRLQVVHSDLPQSEKDRILNLSPEDLIVTLKKILPLSEFPDYVKGQKRFNVPVYAVWGNHEDKEVVEQLFRGYIRIKNLHILHHRQTYRIGPALVYGLGGNFLAGSKLIQHPIAGGAGRIWSTLHQYSDLIKTVEKEKDFSGPRICVSHVSPGKEPFMELIGARTQANFTISGHMGAPACMVWNPFAIRTVEEAEQHLKNSVKKVRETCLKASGSNSTWIDQVLNDLGRLPRDVVDIGRGIKAPRWYRKMNHINLPDAHTGYAVMDVLETEVKLQTFIK